MLNGEGGSVIVIRKDHKQVKNSSRNKQLALEEADICIITTLSAFC